MIGRTNSGIGNLSSGSAIIQVDAPVGSTISFSKNDIVVDVLGPDDGYAKNSTKTEWYYLIKSNNYGTWTVTGTLNGQTYYTNIEINADKRYYVSFVYTIELYKNGTFNSNYTASNLTSSGSISNQSTYIQFNSNASSTAYLYKRWASVDLTGMSKITAAFYNASTHPTYDLNVFFAIWITQSSSVNKFGNATSVVHTDVLEQNSATLTLNISDKTGIWYIAAGMDTNNGKWNVARTGQLSSVIVSS